MKSAAPVLNLNDFDLISKLTSGSFEQSFEVRNKNQLGIPTFLVKVKI
jgi:hypothetical protein